MPRVGRSEELVTDRDCGGLSRLVGAPGALGGQSNACGDAVTHWSAGSEPEPRVRQAIA